MRLSSAILLSCLLGASGAFAQNTQTPAAGSQTPAAGSKTTAPKAGIATDCSKQADAKGLHGKARKHFRSECKKGGGASPT
jgi:hypothetical protein